MFRGIIGAQRARRTRRFMLMCQKSFGISPMKFKGENRERSRNRFGVMRFLERATRRDRNAGETTSGKDGDGIIKVTSLNDTTITSIYVEHCNKSNLFLDKPRCTRIYLVEERYGEAADFIDEYCCLFVKK